MRISTIVTLVGAAGLVSVAAANTGADLITRWQAESAANVAKTTALGGMRTFSEIAATVVKDPVRTPAVDVDRTLKGNQLWAIVYIPEDRRYEGPMSVLTANETVELYKGARAHAYLEGSLAYEIAAWIKSQRATRPPGLSPPGG